MRARPLLASALLGIAACAGPARDPVVSRVLERAPAIDGHNDLVLRFADGDRFDAARFDLVAGTEGSTSVRRWRAGGFGASFVTVGSLREEEPLAGALECIRLVQELAERHSDSIGIARTPDEARALVRAGKIAWILHLEGAEQLEGSSETLVRLHDLGVRSVGLVHEKTNALADSATGEARHGGLSPAGAALIGELNRLGILVDVAHAADETVRDVLEVSAAPPLVTHVALRSIVPSARNLPDELVTAIAERGGIVMIDFVPYHVSAEFARWYDMGEGVWNALREFQAVDPASSRAAMAAWEQDHPPPETSMQDVIVHLERVRELGGARSTGIGSDYGGIGFTIPDLDDVSDLPALLGELARRGWSEDELAALSSENLLRVWDAVHGARAVP